MASAVRQEVRGYGGMSNLEALISDVDKLVSLPDVYYRLESLIEQPSSTMDDFSRILATEPDICARLLSLANSAFYSFPASIESVDKAVRIIGLRQIRELVLATSIIRVFNQVPLGMVNMKLFWEHSVAVGVFAKAIGQYCHQAQSERFYVAGLLHDLGRLVFYLKLPGLMHDLLLERESKEQYLYVLERESLDYTHADAGGQLLRHWRVPDAIYEPVGCHHDPSASRDYPAVTAAVHVADVWVNRNGIGTSGERFAPPISKDALISLNIQEFELEELWNLAQDEIREVINQFLTQ